MQSASVVVTKKVNTNWDVIVLGAGAAGLHCASLAAAQGHRVLVIDHANKAGKKILMSGGGRCNFTNYFIEPSCYLSQNPHFCKSALSRYTQWDFIALVDKYEVAYHEKKLGQLFCDGKSSDILNVLLQECDQQGVQIHLNESIQQVMPLESLQGSDIETVRSEKSRWLIHTDQARYHCQSVVVATGGPSIPTLGATGFGYDLARQFGHRVIEPRAALVPFTISDQWKAVCSALSGTALAVDVSSERKSFSEDMLFTHRGLSGPAILQISSYWLEGEQITIDLLPQLNVAEELRREQHSRPKILLKTWLAEHTTQKFADIWLEAGPLKLLMAKSLADLNGEQMNSISSLIHEWPIKPSGTEGYRTAEVVLGGVDTAELSSKSMESKRQAGLFFIGEVVDVTGHLGGFNFQWAWSSAAAAAENL